MVDDLLGVDGFVTASTWADEVRFRRPETYNWHFVDIPVEATSYDVARDCKPTGRGDCIVAELERARRAMVDVTLTAGQRGEALKFLIHFVGDLHQPLHVTDNHDRGGNDVQIVVFGASAATNLHALWDTALIVRRGMSESAYANFLVQRVDSVETGPIDFAAWAEQTHLFGVKVAYSYQGFSSIGTPREAIAIDGPYLQHTLPLVDQLLTLAAFRLALVLNESFR